MDWTTEKKLYVLKEEKHLKKDVKKRIKGIKNGKTFLKTDKTLKDKEIIIKTKYKSLDDGWGHYKSIKDEIKGFYGDDVKEAVLEFQGKLKNPELKKSYKEIFGDFTDENIKK